MAETLKQEAASLEKEIRDLSGYLDAVPAALRASGALAAYENRLAQLKQELELMLQLLSQTQLPPADESSASY